MDRGATSGRSWHYLPVLQLFEARSVLVRVRYAAYVTYAGQGGCAVVGVARVRHLVPPVVVRAARFTTDDRRLHTHDVRLHPAEEQTTSDEYVGIT